MSNPAPSTSSKLLKPVLIFACILFTLVLKFGFIFLLIALLPAIVAYFIDHEHDKSAFKIVLICNLTAALPSLLPMMGSAIRMERMDIISTMSDARVWLLIYSGAAAGWCLVFLCRFIARFLVILYCEYQVASLERFQKKLLAEWGDQIQQKPDQPPAAKVA